MHSHISGKNRRFVHVKKVVEIHKTESPISVNEAGNWTQEQLKSVAKWAHDKDISSGSNLLLNDSVTKLVTNPPKRGIVHMRICASPNLCDESRVTV